jgi:hypothetical protein
MDDLTMHVLLASLLVAFGRTQNTRSPLDPYFGSLSPLCRTIYNHWHNDQENNGRSGLDAQR